MTIASNILSRFLVSLSVGILLTAEVYWLSPSHVWGCAILLGLLQAYWIYNDLLSAERDEFFQKNARGREMVTHREALRRAEDMKSPGESGILWGKLRLSRRDAVNHFCVVGAVGSGKTITLRMLMYDQLPRITKGSDTRALIYDPKQDMVQIVSSMNLTCPVILLNPFDKRSSAWNIAWDVTTPAMARQLAETLVPDEKESQPFFSDSIRELLAAVVTNFILTRPERWTLRDVLLAMRSKALLREILESHRQTRDKAATIFGASELTVGSIMATGATKLGPYEAIAAAWERCRRKVSIRQWLASEAIFILGNDERMRSTLDVVNQLFVNLTAQHALSLPESSTRLNWLIFDEFSEAGKLQGLQSLILRGRSKGCAVVLGFQDIEHVQSVYEDSRLANALVGQCGNKCFLRMESPETAEWAQKCFGDEERPESSFSQSSSPGGGSYTESMQRQVRPKVMASQFMQLPPHPRQGLEGYYLTRSIGCYTASYSYKEWSQLVGPVDSRILPFDPIPLEWQLLEPCGDADRKRFGVTLEQAATAARTGEPSLDDLTRIQL